MKKTLGQHLENGLAGLGHGINRTVIEARDHELESIKLGLMSDEDKLRMLKQELYRAAMSRANSEHIQNLRSAIAAISNQLEAEHNYRNSPVVLTLSILNSTILLGLLTVFISFPSAWVCDAIHNNSQACQSSRIIPSSIIKFFN